MEVAEIKEQEFGDIFANSGKMEGSAQMSSVKFGSDDTIKGDLFEEKEKEKVEEKIEETEEGKVKDADILGEKEKEKQEVTFTTTSDYFVDRFKSGKFVPIVQEDETGKQIEFIPKTPEEFDEVIDLQVNYKLEEKAKELENNWYESKSPAWKAIAKFSEMVNDPAEILPFLQGVKQVENVSSLDPTDLAHAEKIVKIRLQQRGEDEDVINEQIEALKTTDKLVSTAQKYKPAILSDEKQALSQMMTERKQQELEYNQMVQDIRKKAIESIEAPIYGKQKLKNEEKAAVYDLIGEPSQESSGYAIYSEIDKLFESRDFDKLKKIALILTKEDSLINYISSSASNKTAEQLQKQLRIATESRSSGDGGDDFSGDDKKIIQRKSYSAPRFGR